MVSLLRVVLFALATTAVFAWDSPFTYEEKDTRIDGEYLVVFHSNSTEAARSKHIQDVKNMEDATLLNDWSFEGFHGYGVRCSKHSIAALSEREEVNYVEANQRSFITEAKYLRIVPPKEGDNEPKVGADSCLLQRDVPSWGLTRTTERVNTLNGNYPYPDDSGAGVNVYVIDTGIFVEHPDFGGRAIWGVDTADKPPVLQDLNGHGTHVAGTCISNIYGLARSGTAIAVKVLGADGSGTNDGVIAGINWAVNDHKTRGTGRSVANMSLGGGQSKAINDAVAAGVRAGMIFAVAAGNDGRGVIPSPDACKHSPASEPTAVTVGATDSSDYRADYSNYGKCVKLFAPGSSITSLWKKTTGQRAPVMTISGTSMATPHVAGVLMKLWSLNPTLNGKAITDLLLASTTNNVVKDPKAGSPNKLLYGPCGAV